MNEFLLGFHWSLFLRFQLTISNIGSDNGLVPTRRQAIVWTNVGYFTDAYMRPSASMSWCRFNTAVTLVFSLCTTVPICTLFSQFCKGLQARHLGCMIKVLATELKRWFHWYGVQPNWRLAIVEWYRWLVIIVIFYAVVSIGSSDGHSFFLRQATPVSKVHGANMGPPGACRPQVGPMLAPWSLLSGYVWTRYYIINRKTSRFLVGTDLVHRPDYCTGCAHST